jgi:hypothetical protein
MLQFQIGRKTISSVLIDLDGVHTEEKLNEIGTKFEHSLKNPLDALQMRPGFKI